MLATREEAIEILGPYLQTLRSCVRAAGDYYMQRIPAEDRLWVSARSRACLIYDAMLHLTRTEFAAMPKVSLTMRRGQLRIIIEGRFHMKLKKLNGERLRPSNIQTQPVYEFMHQIQFDFPDAPPALTNIVVGYRLNKTQSAIDGVFIICPNGDVNAWNIDVDDEVLKRALSSKPDNVSLIPTQQHSTQHTSRTAVPLERPAGNKAGESNDEGSA